MRKGRLEGWPVTKEECGGQEVEREREHNSERTQLLKMFFSFGIGKNNGWTLSGAS